MSEPNSIASMVAALNNLWAQLQELTQRLEHVAGPGGMELTGPLETNGYEIRGGIGDTAGLRLTGGDGSIDLDVGIGGQVVTKRLHAPVLRSVVVSSSTTLAANQYDGALVRVTGTGTKFFNLPNDAPYVQSGQQAESWYVTVLNEASDAAFVETEGGWPINGSTFAVQIDPNEIRTFYRRADNSWGAI